MLKGARDATNIYKASNDTLFEEIKELRQWKNILEKRYYWIYKRIRKQRDKDIARIIQMRT